MKLIYYSIKSQNKVIIHQIIMMVIIVKNKFNQV